MCSHFFTCLFWNPTLFSRTSDSVSVQCPRGSPSPWKRPFLLNWSTRRLAIGGYLKFLKAGWNEVSCPCDGVESAAGRVQGAGWRPATPKKKTNNGKKNPTGCVPNRVQQRSVVPEIAVDEVVGFVYRLFGMVVTCCLGHSPRVQCGSSLLLLLLLVSFFCCLV